jgi:uncharacterized protein YchJ
MDITLPAASTWTAKHTTTPVADILRLREERRRFRLYHAKWSPDRKAQIHRFAMDKSRAIGGGLVNIAKMDDITRNGPCPCGSGRKFKRCCKAKSQ